MDEKLIIEVEELLNEAKELINNGSHDEAVAKISEAEDKLKPIGSGTLGPRPKE